MIAREHRRETYRHASGAQNRAAQSPSMRRSDRRSADPKQATISSSSVAGDLRARAVGTGKGPRSTVEAGSRGGVPGATAGRLRAASPGSRSSSAVRRRSSGSARSCWPPRCESLGSRRVGSRARADRDSRSPRRFESGFYGWLLVVVARTGSQPSFRGGDARRLSGAEVVRGPDALPASASSSRSRGKGGCWVGAGAMPGGVDDTVDRCLPRRLPGRAEPEAVAMRSGLWKSCSGGPVVRHLGCHNLDQAVRPPPASDLAQLRQLSSPP